MIAPESPSPASVAVNQVVANLAKVFESACGDRITIEALTRTVRGVLNGTA